MSCSLCMHGNQQFIPVYKMQVPDVVVPWRRPIECPSKGTYLSTAIRAEFGVALPVLYPKSEPTLDRFLVTIDKAISILMDSIIELIGSVRLAGSPVDLLIYVCIFLACCACWMLIRLMVPIHFIDYHHCPLVERSGLLLYRLGLHLLLPCGREFNIRTSFEFHLIDFIIVPLYTPLLKTTSTSSQPAISSVVESRPTRVLNHRKSLRRQRRRRRRRLLPNTSNGNLPFQPPASRAAHDNL
jgi:hypothetical protein